jgi:hypothetical protein
MYIKTKNNNMKLLSMNSCHLPKQQRGLVLVLSLVLLVVMTLIGISSMNNANMELRATANAQQHIKAFNAGQSILEYSISTGAVIKSGGKIDYQTRSAVSQVVEAALDGVTLSALIDYSGCSVGIGSSLEEGRGFSYNFYNISGTGQNNADATALSIQSLGARFPAAACN